MLFPLKSRFYRKNNIIILVLIIFNDGIIQQINEKQNTVGNTKFTDFQILSNYSVTSKHQILH